MPRIRQYTQEVGAGGVLPQVRSATAGDFGGQTAQAMSEFGAQLQTISNHYEKVRKDTLLSGTTAKATQELQEFSYSLKHGSMGEDGTVTAPPDPGTHYKLYNDKVTELRDRYGKAFDDGDAALRGLFEKDFGKVALQQSFDVRTNAIARQKDMARAELDETTDTLSDIFARGDEFVRKSVTEQFRGQIGRFVAAGVIDAVDGNKRIDRFTTMAERAQARELVRTDPDQAIAAFQQGDVFKRMPADEQQKWMDIAAKASEGKQRAQIAEQERLRREQERAEREVQNATYKDAIDLSVQGKLTTRWVLAQRNNISKADYDNLMKLAVKGMPGVGGEGGPRSAEAYSDLRIRAGQGQDVRKEAQAALVGGRITPQQFGGIVSEVESSSPQAKGENWYKNGKDYIRTALAPSQTNPGIDREVMARALDDWQRFSDANPSATAQERDRMRDTIVESSRLIASDQILTSIPRPKFLAGDKQTANTKQVYEATKQAYLKGQITRAEFDREARNIDMLNEWQKKNPPKPKAAEKGKR